MGTKKACGPTEDKDTATFDSDVKNINNSNNKKNKTSHYLIIGLSRETETFDDWQIGYSDKETFREIVTDFVKTLDKTTNKTKSTIFSDTITQFKEEDNIEKLVLALVREMFESRIVMIAEISTAFLGVELLKKLKMEAEKTNEPLPF